MPIFQYLSFAGNRNSYGELPKLVLAGEQVFTIEVIFSTTNTREIGKTQRPNWGTIAGREISDTFQNDWGLCVNAGKLCFWAEPKDVGTKDTAGTFSEAFVSDGKIHHVAVVSNNAGAIVLYCDGEVVAHHDGVHARITNQETILLGYNSGGGSALDMNLYEIRFWNIARTAEEIYQQHRLSKEYLLAPLMGDEDGLQAWYIPTNNATLIDKSPNKYNATLTGVTYNTVDTLNVSYKADVARRIKNAALTWRYYNAGTADLLSISGVTLPDLPEEQSKTGSAFFQTAKQKCFDISDSTELWIRFDVFFDGINRWRAYNGATGTNGFSTGITAQTTNVLYFWANNVEVDFVNDIALPNQLQTFLMHLKSDSERGMIEVWTARVPYTWNDVDYIFENDNIDATLRAAVAEEIFGDDSGATLSAQDIQIIFGDDIAIDENKILTYIGNVNEGRVFDDFYLQSDGAGTFFSNVIISNAEFDLYYGMAQIHAIFDVARQIRNTLQVTYDVAREVHNVTTVTFAADVKLQTNLPVTLTADIVRKVTRACQLNLDVVFMEAFHDIDFTVPVRRSLVTEFSLFPLNFDDYWQPEQRPLLRGTKKLLAAEVDLTPTYTPPDVIPAAQNKGDIQSIELKFSEQQITDVLKFTTTTPFAVRADVLGRYFDFICNMRVESVQLQGSLYSVVCCSNIDELFYTPLNYDLPSISYGVWYDERVVIPQVICPLASEHVAKIAAALNLQAVMQFQDFYSTVEFGESSENGASYNDIIRDIFGWTSRVPTDLINVFIRNGVLYVIQRGFESRVIDISGAQMARPSYTHEIVRMFYKRSKYSETEVREIKTRRRPTNINDLNDNGGGSSGSGSSSSDSSGGDSSGNDTEAAPQWVATSSVTVTSSDGTTTTTYNYDANGLLLNTTVNYTCYSDKTKSCITTTDNSYNSDGTINRVSVEARHLDAPEDDTKSITSYGYITFLGKSFLATEVVEKYSMQANSQGVLDWNLDDTIVTSKNPTGRGQGAATDSKGNTSAGGNRGDDTPSPFYSDSSDFNILNDFDTTKQYRDIDGLTLFDTSFPIQNISQEQFDELHTIDLPADVRNSVDTAKGTGRLIELTEKIKWLNGKTKETVFISIYDVPHIIDFNDRIRLFGNEYFLVENIPRSHARLRNEQNLTLVRWF